MSSSLTTPDSDSRCTNCGNEVGGSWVETFVTEEDGTPVCTSVLCQGCDLDKRRKSYRETGVIDHDLLCAAIGYNQDPSPNDPVLHVVYRDYMTILQAVQAFERDTWQHPRNPLGEVLDGTCDALCGTVGYLRVCLDKHQDSVRITLQDTHNNQNIRLSVMDGGLGIEDIRAQQSIVLGLLDATARSWGNGRLMFESPQ